MDDVKWRIGVTLKQLEKSVILASMRHFDGNKTKVAASLEVSLRTIDNKIKLYNLQEKKCDS